jgi:hypothetical protein
MTDTMLISTRYTFFGKSFQRNTGLSMLGPEQFGMDDRLRTCSRVCISKHKVRRKRVVLVCGASLKILESF